MRQENFVRAGAVFGVTDLGTGLHQQGERGRPSHVRDLGAVVDGQCLELLASLVDGTEFGLGQSQSSTEPDQPRRGLDRFPQHVLDLGQPALVASKQEELRGKGVVEVDLIGCSLQHLGGEHLGIAEATVQRGPQRSPHRDRGQIEPLTVQSAPTAEAGEGFDIVVEPCDLSGLEMDDRVVPQQHLLGRGPVSHGKMREQSGQLFDVPALPAHVV